MSKNNNNTPRLRFPGFTGEWEEKKLGDYFELLNGYTFKSDSYISNGSYKIITISNVQSGLLDMSRYNSIELLPSNIAEHQKLKLGDIILSMTGNVGRVCIVNEPNCLLNQRVGLLKQRNNKVDKRYLYSLINSTQFEDAMKKSGQGAAQANISKDNIESFPILVPSSPEEQKKIADCLFEMDNLISAQAQKVEALKEKKKGMMQELFPQKGETTPRLRFPEFTGEWEEKRLKEIFVLRNGYTPLKGEDSYWTDGEIPWFRMEDIREKGNVLYDSTQHITQKAIKGKGCFNANTIILATSATIGEHALIKVAHLANQRFVNLEINPMYSREISIEYAYYYMYIIDEICKSIGNIGTFASVSTEALSNLLFVYPSTFAEQQKIADCLSELDTLIASETKQLEALKDHKKGLMQQLFPQPAK